MKREDGFSLLEVLVAIGIMMALMEAVAVAYVHMFSQSKKHKVTSTLDEQSKYLGNYFTYRIQSVGGGAARPWASVWTENDCAARAPFPACSGSDRVTTATSIPAAAECTIVGAPAAGTLQAAVNAGICCLTVADHENKQGVISNGNFFSQVLLTGVDTAACTVNFAPGLAFAGLNNSPGAVAGWINGRITVTDLATLYLDTATNELREFRDLDFDGVIDAGEESVLADRVFDLQLALGYDANPRDGRAVNTGDDADEWLFNSNGVNEGMGIGGLVGGQANDLRMIVIGLVLGERVPNASGGQISVLNGPLRSQPDWQLTRTQVKFRFRNIGIFLPNG